MKVGLIQTRGIGDIIIALPIAKHFKDIGKQVYWPIDEKFLSSFQEVVSWVNWLGVSSNYLNSSIDPNFLYGGPSELLAKVGVESILPLYNYLGPPHSGIANKLLQPILKFDQYKYAVSGVPFKKKWTLKSCLNRNQAREDLLFDRLVKQEKYMVIHQKGSDFEKLFDLVDAREKGYQIIEISEVTDNIFDWLKILENAKGLALIDSVFANLVDQLEIGVDVPKYFGLRSHALYTPVLMGSWNYI
jgi:hypothetical protein